MNPFYGGGTYIGVSPPSNPFPILSPSMFPPFPTLWVGLSPPGCSQGATGCIGFATPDFSGLMGWLLQCLFVFFGWLADMAFWLLNWGLYLIVAGIAGLINGLITGLIAITSAWLSTTLIVADYTGPLAPVTAALMIAGFAVFLVLVVLFLAGVGIEAVNSAKSSGGGGGGGGGPSPEEEELLLA